MQSRTGRNRLPNEAVVGGSADDCKICNYFCDIDLCGAKWNLHFLIAEVSCPLLSDFGMFLPVSRVRCKHLQRTIESLVDAAMFTGSEISGGNTDFV